MSDEKEKQEKLTGEGWSDIREKKRGYVHCHSCNLRHAILTILFSVIDRCTDILFLVQIADHLSCLDGVDNVLLSSRS
jgi:hypothetical protein